MKIFTACNSSLGQSKALLPVAFIQQLMPLVPVSHLTGRRWQDESQRGCDQGCCGRPESCTQCWQHGRLAQPHGGGRRRLHHSTHHLPTWVEPTPATIVYRGMCRSLRSHLWTPAGFFSSTDLTVNLLKSKKNPKSKQKHEHITLVLLQWSCLQKHSSSFKTRLQIKTHAQKMEQHGGGAKCNAVSIRTKFQWHKNKLSPVSAGRSHVPWGEHALPQSGSGSVPEGPDPEHETPASS